MTDPMPGAGAPVASTMMHWLPQPTNFRGDLQAALAVSDPVHRFDCLSALARHKLSLLETIQLDHALGAISTRQPAGVTPVRLAILGASTVDHLGPAIRVAGLRWRLPIELHIGPYGQYRQQLLDAASPLKEFGPHVVLLSLSARDTVSAVAVSASSAEVNRTIAQWLDEVRLLWRKARETLNASVIQQTLVNFAEPLFGNSDRLVPGAPAQVIAEMNRRLAETAVAEGVLLLDIARASERDGLDTWYDTGRWLQAKMEISQHAAPLYGELVARILAAQRGLSKKCLVLDLDNTLWGGIVGDDGLEGIVLGEGSATRGSSPCPSAVRPATARSRRHPRRLFAQRSRRSPRRCSAITRRWFLSVPTLRPSSRTGKTRRPISSASPSSSTSALDSLVFVDDNPAERARIRQSLPMVAVPELPADPAQYVRCLANAGYFEAVCLHRRGSPARRAVRRKQRARMPCCSPRRAWRTSCAAWRCRSSTGRSRPSTCACSPAHQQDQPVQSNHPPAISAGHHRPPGLRNLVSRCNSG